jgi:hypothetical protein
VVVAHGTGYEIWAGADDDDDLQGLIVVHQAPKDVCADPQDTGRLVMLKDSVGRAGPLTLTSVTGSAVGFSRQNGTQGSLDLDTMRLAR